MATIHHVLYQHALLAALESHRVSFNPWWATTGTLDHGVIRAGNGKIEIPRVQPMTAERLPMTGFRQIEESTHTRQVAQQLSQTLMPREMVRAGTSFAWNALAGNVITETTVAQTISELVKAVADEVTEYWYETLFRTIPSYYPADGVPLDVSAVDIPTITQALERRHTLGFSRASVPWVWMRPDLKAQLFTLAPFYQSNIRGDGASSVILEDEAAKTYGVRWFTDHIYSQRYSHTAGTATGEAITTVGTISGAGVAGGARTMALSGGTEGNTIVAGDLFSFPDGRQRTIVHPDQDYRGDDYTYTFDAGSGIASVAFYPSVADDIPAGQLEFVGDHNFAVVHQPASAYVTGMFTVTDADVWGGVADVMSVTDTGSAEYPGTGASMALVLHADANGWVNLGDLGTNPYAMVDNHFHTYKILLAQ